MHKIVNMRIINLFLACLVGTAVMAQGPKADQIYFGGDILTMKGSAPVYVEAVAVSGGKILATGTKGSVMATKGATTKLIDLKGATLMPGFIDAHGHVSTAADYKKYAFLRGEKVKNMGDLQAELKSFAQSMGVKSGDYILGNGFDASLLAEKRNPTADDLDKVSATDPVFIVHASGHMGVANHKMLELAGITAATPDPAGGKIMRKEGSQEPNGILEENAFFKVWEMVPALDDKTGPQYMKLAMDQAVATGLTTIQEAGMRPGQMPVLIDASRKGILPIDVVAFATDVFSDQLKNILTSPENTPLTSIIPGMSVSRWGEEAIRSGKDYLGNYKGHFRIAGLKMWMDGSPLAGTALLRQPYTAKFPGKDADYKGFTNATDEDLYNFLDRWYPQRFLIQVHVNGDGTADQFIRVVERIVKKHGFNEGKIVMIHCSLVEEDQLVKLKQLGVYPSFYSTTLPEGAESFAEQIGDRINRMSPAALAAKHDMVYTIHNDEP